MYYLDDWILINSYLLCSHGMLDTNSKVCNFNSLYCYNDCGHLKREIGEFDPNKRSLLISYWDQNLP